MSYKVTHKGSRGLRTIDLECPSCHYHEERDIDYRELAQDDGTYMEPEINCPNCETLMEQVWKKAPGSISKEGSAESIAKMKKASHERFIKKEETDVRHKFGRLYDDAKQSSAAQEIKKGLKQ